MTERTNREGLTWAEWSAATGRSVLSTPEYEAWLAGEDPTEWRKGEGMKIYAATSWRNPHHDRIVALLRAEGHRVYDFRNPSVDGPIGAPDSGFSWREVDEGWKSWTREKYRAALRHPIAQQGYYSDFQGMSWADACVITLPCGRSAHLEAGWMMGRGKPTAVYLPPEFGPCDQCGGRGWVDGVDPARNARCSACVEGKVYLWNFEPELMYLLGGPSASHLVVSDDELKDWLRHADSEVRLKDQTRQRQKRNIALGLMKAMGKVSGVDLVDDQEKHNEAYKTVMAWLREYDLT